MLVNSPPEVSTVGVFANCATHCRWEADEAPPGKHVDILVVDDNEIIADTTCEILKRFGFSVVAAYDGGMALRMAAEMCPDILLSDVMMPVMNGVELAISVRKILPETAVLLVTGQATEDIFEDAGREGYFFETLNKPIHPVDLVGHLNRLRRT